MDFKVLLELMVEKKASDLFITAGMPPSMKVAGRLVPVSSTKLGPEQARQLVLSVMTPTQRDSFERELEANFAISATGLGRFRVSAFFQRNQAGMVLRRIETYIPASEELGLPPVVNQLALLKRGLVLFVGATGSGKSTSLAAMIGHRNRNSSGHIITIEDPIEFIHPHVGCIVSQREVGLDTASFEVALRNALRQAPDVVQIGEIRSRETMDHALAFAETGHLCLATLHANNADQALDRIVNFFPADRHNQLYLDLSLSLKGVVAQQLVPTADGKGRVPAVEVLLGTPLVADRLRSGEIHELKEIMKRSREQGMQTFDQHLFELYQAGRIGYEDALRHADSRNEVRLMAKLDTGGSRQLLDGAGQGLGLLQD